MRNTQTVFCQNQSDLRTLVDSGLLSESRCKLIPGSGVDLVRFAPGPSLSENRPRRFLMFGRLVPQKGYEQFLHVATDLSRRSKALAELWIMGIEDESRRESRALLGRILSLHRKGKVTFIPARDDVVSVLKEVDVAVLPSQYNEGVPRSLLEAMACGKPIITSDWRGCRETVEDGVNGYLVEPGDWKVLKRRVVDLATCSWETLRSMGQASRRIAEAKFNEDIVISAYLEEIDQIADELNESRQEGRVEAAGFIGNRDAFEAEG